MSEHTYTADDIAREEAQLDRAAWGRMHDDFEEHATDDRSEFCVLHGRYTPRSLLDADCPTCARIDAHDRAAIADADWDYRQQNFD